MADGAFFLPPESAAVLLQRAIGKIGEKDWTQEEWRTATATKPRTSQKELQQVVDALKEKAAAMLKLGAVVSDGDLVRLAVVKTLTTFKALDQHFYTPSMWESTRDIVEMFLRAGDRGVRPNRAELAGPDLDLADLTACCIRSILPCLPYGKTGAAAYRHTLALIGVFENEPISWNHVLRQLVFAPITARDLRRAAELMLWEAKRTANESLSATDLKYLSRWSAEGVPVEEAPGLLKSLIDRRLETDAEPDPVRGREYDREDRERISVPKGTYIFLDGELDVEESRVVIKFSRGRPLSLSINRGTHKLGEGLRASDGRHSVHLTHDATTNSVTAAYSLNHQPDTRSECTAYFDNTRTEPTTVYIARYGPEFIQTVISRATRVGNISPTPYLYPAFRDYPVRLKKTDKVPYPEQKLWNKPLYGLTSF
ncbi:hypothetical protein DIPPA_11578 [Diplonema papillatum]|nr:hypothetical protein DIPPA_11578 [Diplonema papillatum]